MVKASQSRALQDARVPEGWVLASIWQIEIGHRIDSGRHCAVVFYVVVNQTSVR